jgi:hypothetical protein
MFVRLSTHEATVGETENLTDLYVSTALPPSEIDHALRGTGTGRLTDGGAALLDVDVLRSRARNDVGGQAWGDEWEAMIAYARRKGWLSPDGKMVQAHVERH